MSDAPEVVVDLAVALAARDAVLAQLARARELASADARYRVTVASLEHTLRELGLALAIALSAPTDAPKEPRP